MLIESGTLGLLNQISNSLTFLQSEFGDYELDTIVER